MDTVNRYRNREHKKVNRLVNTKLTIEITEITEITINRKR